MGWLCHRRLGHVGKKQLKKLTTHNLVNGLNDVEFEKNKLCSACQAGKQVGSSHPKKSTMSTCKAFGLMHMDLFGPTTYFKTFLTRVHNEFEIRIKKVRSDNGSQFKNTRI
jgi:hypothetical protein